MALSDANAADVPAQDAAPAPAPSSQELPASETGGSPLSGEAPESKSAAERDDDAVNNATGFDPFTGGKPRAATMTDVVGPSLPPGFKMGPRLTSGEVLKVFGDRFGIGFIRGGAYLILDETGTVAKIAIAKGGYLELLHGSEGRVAKVRAEKNDVYLDYDQIQKIKNEMLDNKKVVWPPKQKPDTRPPLPATPGVEG